MPNLIRLFILFIFIFLVYNNLHLFVHAQVSSCSATVSPASISPNSSGTMTFTVTNSSETNIDWVRFTRSSSNFTITSGGASGWSSTYTDSYITFIENSIDSGGSASYTLNVNTGDAISSSEWTVVASDSGDGSSPATCSGSPSVAIETSTETILAISNISVSSTDTSATITWTTGGATTGSVEYGTTSSYGSQTTDSTSGTSHSITATGLTASTTYHFRVNSTDTDSNTTQSSDYTFSTAAAGGTTTVTVSTSTTNTVTVVTEIKDIVLPSFTLTTDFEKIYREAPEIVGKATDNGGIGQIDYSIDDGKNWIHLNLAVLGEKEVDFVFTPEIREDGSYKIRVKVVDSTGNEKVSNPYSLVIDRLSPLVGGSVFSIGPQILTPSEDGRYVIVEGISPKITFSAVGGPESIDLQVGEVSTKALKNTENGLWSSKLEMGNNGEYDVLSTAIDGADNSTVQTIATLNVISNGVVTLNNKPVIDALVSVYYFDPQSLKYSLWEGKQYAQENPQKTDINGNYKLFLPPGTFYILVSSPNTNNVKSEIFTLTQSTPITVDFELNESQVFRLGPLVLKMPDIFINENLVDIQNDKLTGKNLNLLTGTELPYFNLGGIDSNSLRGRSTLVSVTSSWHPQTVEQLSVLETVAGSGIVDSVVILSEESETSVSIFAKRANYSFPLIADPDGVLVKPMSLTSLPTHYFVNRKGVIMKVKTGLLSKAEIEQILNDI
jgi:Purple acid Phosphatase, N-terminal domain